MESLQGRHSSAGMSGRAISLAMVMAIAMMADTVPFPAQAQQASAALSRSQPGFHAVRVGDVEVIALSDGTVSVESNVLIARRPADITRHLGNAFQQSPVDMSINAFLFRSGSRLVLVDAGVAELYGPSANKLPQAIQAAGHAAEQVTDILITHIHPDHVGGLMQGSARAFPHARVHVDRRELDYWLNPANKLTAREDHKPFFDAAQARFKPYVDSGQVHPFVGPADLFEGVRAIAAPGHTPGHSFFLLESKREKLMFWGDVLHVADVQFPDPDVTVQFDFDTAAARRTREKAFADAARGRYLVAATHISFPGIGHVSREAQDERDGHRHGRTHQDLDEYRFYPVPYVNNAAAAR